MRKSKRKRKEKKSRSDRWEGDETAMWKQNRSGLKNKIEKKMKQRWT